MDTVATIEGQLEQQESDAAEVKRHQEEEQKKVEEERSRLEEEKKQKKLAQEVAAREKLERTWKMAEDEKVIMIAERELEAKKLVLSAQKAASNIEDEDEDADLKSTQPVGKCVKTASSSSSQVQFNGIMLLKGTRKSVWTTKAQLKEGYGGIVCTAQSGVRCNGKDL